MAQDMFLRLSGIDAGSNDAIHKNSILVTSWKWEVQQKSNMHSGTAGGVGKATIKDLRLEHYADRASPNLMKYCLSGKHIPEAMLVVCKAGGNSIESLKITMNDVMVTGVYLLGGNDAEGVLEQFVLSFAKLKQEYVVQNAQGGSSGAVIAVFDIKANRAI